MEFNEINLQMNQRNNNCTYLNPLPDILLDLNLQNNSDHFLRAENSIYYYELYYLTLLPLYIALYIFGFLKYSILLPYLFLIIFLFTRKSFTYKVINLLIYTQLILINLSESHNLGILKLELNSQPFYICTINIFYTILLLFISLVDMKQKNSLKFIISLFILLTYMILLIYMKFYIYLGINCVGLFIFLCFNFEIWILRKEGFMNEQVKLTFIFVIFCCFLLFSMLNIITSKLNDIKEVNI